MILFKHWMGIVGSVMASFFGVQSQNQYIKDANSSSFVPFLVVGVIMVILLIVTIWLGVGLLISNK